MHWLLLIIGLAALVQLLAAFLALRLIGITGGRIAWMMIALALCCMALRRGVEFWRLVSRDFSYPANLFDEGVSLAISLCMLAAVLWISPLFLTIQRSPETLKQSKEKLATVAAKRKAALHDANIHLSVELDEERRSEKMLAQFAADRKRSNAELEQFA